MPDTAYLQDDQFKRADRISDIGVSEILEIGARAQELRMQGQPVITLGAGEPDFNTPNHVKAAAYEAINANQTKYTPLVGTESIRKAIQAKLKRDNNLTYQLNEITVGSGAKQILFNAFMATINPGDEVIVPAPYWTSYIDLIKIAGGHPVIVPCTEQNGFKMVPAQLKAALSKRTKWILFNSPSNPSGAVYSEADYQPLLNILLDHPDVWIMADDIYEHIVYKGAQFITPAAAEPRLRSRCLIVNGVSKAYAMTGWRLGFGAGPADLIKAMSVIQSNSTSAPSSISQAAAAEALSGSQDCLLTQRDSFCERRDYIVDRFNQIEGLSCDKPDGAFYAYVNCQSLLGRKTPLGGQIETDSALCRYLLDRAFVAVVPGSAFGVSPYFRVSYAASESELKAALDRIAAAISELEH